MILFEKKKKKKKKDDLILFFNLNRMEFDTVQNSHLKWGKVSAYQNNSLIARRLGVFYKYLIEVSFFTADLVLLH